MSKSNPYLSIKFQGNDYLLIGGTMETGGAIATREQFAAFTPSYAVLTRNGEVKRYGETIGKRADIEVVGPAEDVATPSFDTVVETLLDPQAKGFKS
jgi:hypothetical protein